MSEERLVKLRYGIQALARYKGRLASEAMLPADGNSIGDT